MLKPSLDIVKAVILKQIRLIKMVKASSKMVKLSLLKQIYLIDIVKLFKEMVKPSSNIVLGSLEMVKAS